MDAWVEVNTNPCGKRVGDCAIRAVSEALGINWDKAYCLLASKGFAMCDVMNADSVIGAVLKDHGFSRSVIPNSCPDCFTAEDFCNVYQIGVFVLFFGGHVAAVKNGKIYDSWNSSKEIPQYYWMKK